MFIKQTLFVYKKYYGALIETYSILNNYFSIKFLYINGVCFIACKSFLGPRKTENSCKIFILLAMVNKKAQLLGQIHVFLFKT